MTERDAKAKGIKYRVGRNYYSKIVGGIKMGYSNGADDNGFAKILVGEDKKLLGVHVVGPQAALLVQPFVYLMSAGYKCTDKKARTTDLTSIDALRMMCPSLDTYEPILNAMVIHPSLNELTAWAFENLE